MLVRGRSGIGKTTLIRRFLRGLGDSVFVLEGRCFEREAVPFKMLDGVVDSLTGAIVGAAAAGRRAAGAARPRLAGPAVPGDAPRAQVRRAGRRAARRRPIRRRCGAAGSPRCAACSAGCARMRPLVIFVDDAHWGDADSAVFLAELIHAAEPGTLIVRRAPPRGLPRGGRAGPPAAGRQRAARRRPRARDPAAVRRATPPRWSASSPATRRARPRWSPPAPATR